MTNPVMANGHPDVSILIVSWKTRELVLECIHSVHEHTAGTSFEIIVIDNASGDGTPEAVRERFPETRVLESPENRGFGAACNMGAEVARGEALLLLNPDTRLVSDALTALWRASRESAGDVILGGRTLDASGELDPRSCWQDPSPWSALCQALGLASTFRGSRLFDPESMGHWRRDSVREVDIITGCLLMTRRRFWEQLQGFDERFFMYGEDFDLCMRARAAGARCVLVPSASIVHLVGKSDVVFVRRRVSQFVARAQLYHKHWTPIAASFGVWTLSLWAGLRCFAFSLLARVRPGYADRRAAWRDVWTQRSKWKEVGIDGRRA